MWIKKNPWGRDIHPWEEITLDQLSPELRQLVTKMARVASQDFFEEVRETFWEAVSIELGKRIQDALTGVQGAPGAAPEPLFEGGCRLCDGEYQLGMEVMPMGHGTWMHFRPQECGASKTARPADQKGVNP